MDINSISVDTCMLFCTGYRFLAKLVCDFTYTNYFCQYLYVSLHIPMNFVNTCMQFYIYPLFLSLLVCYFPYTNYFRRYLYVILHTSIIAVATCMLFYMHQLFLSLLVCYFTYIIHNVQIHISSIMPEYIYCP